VYAAIGRGGGETPDAAPASDARVAVVVAAVDAPIVARDVRDVADAAVVVAPTVDAAVVAVAHADAGRRVDAATAITAEPTDPRLAAAERALAGGDDDGAERLAFEVAMDASAPVAARDRAHGIRGAVACSAHNSIEAARGELRQIVEDARARARVVEVCRRAGYALE
jgi:hypothetical protein